MGTYLSTPVVEKGEESGESPDYPLAWGVVDMQGWRKSMEDAHVAQTDVPVPPHLRSSPDEDEELAKVFGVFDGHGGAEVARFVALYLVDVLSKQPTWAKEVESEDPLSSPVGQALIDAFHSLDRMIDQPERRSELIRLRTEKLKPGERKTTDHIPIPESTHHEETSEEKEEAVEESKSIEMNDLSKPEEEKREGENQGSPEREAKLESDESMDFSNENHVAESEERESPAVTDEKEDGAKPKAEADDSAEGTEEAKVDESFAEMDTAQVQESAFEKTDEQPDSQDESEAKLASTESDGGSDSKEADMLEEAGAVQDTPENSAEKEEAVDVAPSNNETEKTEESTAVQSPESETVEANPKDDETKESPNPVGTDTPSLKDEGNDPGKTKNSEESEGEKDLADNEGNSPADPAEDDDSDAAVGKEAAAELDQDLMIDDSDEDKEIESGEGHNRKVTVMFQKLLSLGGNAGQMTLKIGDKDTAAKSENADTGVTKPAAPDIVPTVIQNGRQICNLPDHPIHAGCTAIVSVLIGGKLTIANAGDSRGVLCRAGGRTEALSFDHKPQQDRELNRITNAGGFVNQFGRVNGNLNLSRSIGDLKYKQVPGIHPAHQMITAEPDIVEVFLQPNDEFFILGCDGIWDCLTNTQAVKYVRDRIDTMTPTQIGVQMLDEIISDDPRATQGIGGDNMTVMVIDLQPATRSYAK